MERPRRAVQSADASTEANVASPVMRGATPAQKDSLKKLSPAAVTATSLAGEEIISRLTSAPGNGAPLGGLKVTTENGWFAARPSGTENIYKLYAESLKSAGHLSALLEEAQVIVSKSL